MLTHLDNLDKLKLIREHKILIILYLVQLIFMCVREELWNNKDDVKQAKVVGSVNLIFIATICWMCYSPIDFNATAILAVPYLAMLTGIYVDAIVSDRPWQLLQFGMAFFFYLSVYLCWTKLWRNVANIWKTPSPQRRWFIFCGLLHTGFTIACMYYAYEKTGKWTYLRSFCEQLLLLSFYNFMAPQTQKTQADAEGRANSVSTANSVASIVIEGRANSLDSEARANSITTEVRTNPVAERGANSIATFFLLTFLVLWGPLWIFRHKATGFHKTNAEYFQLGYHIAVSVCLIVTILLCKWSRVFPSFGPVDVGIGLPFLGLIGYESCYFESYTQFFTDFLGIITRFLLWHIGPTRKMLVLCALGHCFFVSALVGLESIDPSFKSLLEQVIAIQFAAKIAFDNFRRFHPESEWEARPTNPPVLTTDNPSESEVEARAIDDSLKASQDSPFSRTSVVETLLIILYLSYFTTETLIGFWTGWQHQAFTPRAKHLAITQIVINIVVLLATSPFVVLKWRATIHKSSFFTPLRGILVLVYVGLCIATAIGSRLWPHWRVLTFYPALSLCWFTMSTWNYCTALLHCLLVVMVATSASFGPWNCSFAFLEEILLVLFFSLLERLVPHTHKGVQRNKVVSHCCAGFLILRYVLYFTSWGIQSSDPTSIMALLTVQAIFDGFCLVIALILFICSNNIYNSFHWSFRDITICVPWLLLVAADGTNAYFDVSTEKWLEMAVDCFSMSLLYLLWCGVGKSWLRIVAAVFHIVLLILAFALRNHCHGALHTFQSAAGGLMLCQLLVTKFFHVPKETKLIAVTRTKAPLPVSRSQLPIRAAQINTLAPISSSQVNIPSPVSRSARSSLIPRPRGQNLSEGEPLLPKST